jgi:stage V sporulation protein B
MEERRSVSAGLFLALLLAILPATAFWLFGRLFTPLLPDERCLPVLNILLIGGVFAAAFAVLRGQMWGNKKFLTPTLFELLEESALVIAGVCFLYLDGKIPLIERAAWANTISYALSFSVAFSCFFLDKNKLSSPLPLAKPLFQAALPITAIRLTSSLLVSAVAILLPAMLVRAGATQSDALKTYGVLTGMVLPVLFIPSTLVGSISLVIAPQLSEDYYRKNEYNLKRNVERGLLATALLAGLLAPALFVLGEESGKILFSSQIAGEMIKNGSPILLPMSLSMISTTILNSLGFQKQTLRYYFVGALALTASILFLPYYLGGYAYLVGMGLNFTLNTLCNLFFLKRRKILPHRLLQKLIFIAACVLPISLFGQFIKSLCVGFLGEFGACVTIGASICAFAVGLYGLCFRKKGQKNAVPQEK